MRHNIINNYNNNIMIPVGFVIIGQIGGVYGILGWIKVISFTDQIDSIFNYKPWILCSKFQKKIVYLDKWRFLGKCYIAKIKGISDRESAKLLMHYLIVIDVQKFPYLSDGEYYCKDLIGCTVIIDYSNIYIGCVISIMETNAHDVLVVKISEDVSICKKKECLIPFVEDKIIKKVNIYDRVIIVDWDINF